MTVHGYIVIEGELWLVSVGTSARAIQLNDAAKAGRASIWRVCRRSS